MTQTRGRRAFLQGAAAGLAALGAAPALTACQGVVRQDLPDAALGRPHGVSLQEAEWLALAGLAPSGHNAQPWTVHIAQPGRWVIGSARERWLPVTDPENRELLLSIGAFLENLQLAVGTRGYRLEARPLTEVPHAAELLEVRLTPCEPVPYPLERLRLRRMVRRGFRSRPLRPADWEALQRLGPQQLFYFPVGSAPAGLLDAATLEANRAQSGHIEAQRELAAWIRWRDAGARTLRDGLTPEAMGLHGLTGWYVRHFYTPADVLTTDFRRRTLERVAELVQHHGGWLVVTSPSARLMDLLQAGRLFERLALRVREHGIALQPMSQCLEEAPWRNRLQEQLGLPGPPQMVVRLGYLDDYPRPVSLRMPIARYVAA